MKKGTATVETITGPNITILEISKFKIKIIELKNIVFIINNIGNAKMMFTILKLNLISKLSTT